MITPTLHKSEEPDCDPDVDSLLKFKELKDNADPGALEIWNNYVRSGDQKALNSSIMVLLKGQRTRKLPPPNLELPPGGIDTYPDEGMCVFLIDLSFKVSLF